MKKRFKPEDEEEEEEDEEEDEFDGNLRKAIAALKEKDDNRTVLITKLWKYFNKHAKDGDYLSYYFHSSDEVKEWSSLLLERLKEEKEGKEIAAVLAVCHMANAENEGMTKSLFEGGLADQLVAVLNSHCDNADVAERGLFAAGSLAWCPGKECVNRVDDNSGFFSSSVQVLLIQRSWLIWASSLFWRRS